jgi:hypothetical protein
MRLNLGNISIAPNIWQAAAIIALIFALLLILAYMSRNFLEWSLSGFGIGLVIGFIIAIVLEGFLIIGGKTVIISVLNWKTAPPQVQKIINDGHQKLLETLNVPASCSSYAK